MSTLPNGALKSDVLNVLVLGGTGTAGRAAVHALVRRGHAVTCLIRLTTPERTLADVKRQAALPESVNLRLCQVDNLESLRADGFRSDSFDAFISCMASRSGAADDAWAIAYQAHSQALALAEKAGVRHMVMLSALCVQKPRLAFQHAKLAFEKELINSGLTYSIVRPTAFFKSLAGQVKRVRRGKPFLVFGDGTLTACKPISDNDLGDFIASCLSDKTKHNKILPIGGPGPAITPREQGEYLFKATGQKPRFRQVPIGLLEGIGLVLKVLGRFSATCKAKAELVGIGRYYATESMLVLNDKSGQYDEHATPSYGTETLQSFYTNLLNGSTSVDLGEHALFDDRV